MVTNSNGALGRSAAGTVLSKVPEVTILFWIVTVLATTVGESVAGFLAHDLDLGLTNTSYLMSVVLAGAVVVQLRAERYVPGVYWLTVGMFSIVGTLITENLVENLGVSLVVTTLVLGSTLAICFVVWFKSEGTLSIHPVRSLRQEAFYWLTILLTFALGAAAGDLLAEKLDVGYWTSALIFAGTIALLATARLAVQLNTIVAFWIGYVLTRPLGASIGDYLTQQRRDGGLGLGTGVTTAVFAATIVAIVSYSAMTKTDHTVGL